MIKNFSGFQRTPILLALGTLLIAWTLTLLAWETARNATFARQHAEFESLTRESVENITRRLGVYEQILRASRGFLRNSATVSDREYRAYIENLNLGAFFPGIQGIGVSEIVRPENRGQHEARIALGDDRPGYRIWPPGERSTYTAITRLEPLDLRNLRALGFDMYSEPVRRQAMARARDTGEAAMTGKVTLVQEGATNVQPGFLMYLPIYAAGMPIATEAQRRQAILGWVYAPFRMHDFIEGLGGVSRPELELTIFDGFAPSAESCLFGCTTDATRKPIFETQRTIENGGQTWHLQFQSTPAFEQVLANDTPRLILGGGLITGALLAGLVGVLAAGRGRALALAAHMTQELRASHDRIEVDQQRMRSVLESSLDAFAATDSEGRVTDWNAAASQLFGWSAQEAIGRGLAAHIALEADGNPVASVCDLLGESQAGVRLEASASRRDGRRIPIELSLASVSHDRGPLAHVFIRDLSTEKDTQAREARQREALEEARAALQHALRLEAVGKLTGGVAHDFNNVLQIISANIQLMQYFAGDDPRMSGRLDSAMQAVDRGARLSSQLLSFARRQPLQPQVVDLRDLLGEMRELIRRAAGPEIEIGVEADKDIGNTVVDPSQLENVLLNLVINGRDAMQGRGKLCMELRNVTLRAQDAASFPDLRPGAYVMLAISDTGSGMSDEVMEHAFEPFFTTKPRGEGTGLGLSMAYGFVKQSEGHIALESEPGKGTTVRIYLPRASVETPPSPAMEQHNENPGPGGDETILVVEDDPGVRETVVPLLSQLGYRILTADNADQACTVLNKGHSIDLLFTDVIMPGKVSSTELAQQAKLRFPDIGVLFTSGYTQDAIVHGGRLDPGVHLLSKPYRAHELSRKVRAVLDARNKAAKTA